MISQKNKVIFTTFVKENKLKFNYIDVGARGDIASPWSELEENSFIVGFEPDTEEASRLNNTFPSRKYFDIALWNNDTTRKVYINEWESTSSMYEPNLEFISMFERKHWEGRKPKSIIDVQCNALDNILEKNNIIPDFIKIDTQGAELEILKGTENILKQYAPLVTCETWCAEVYKNAPMMHDVIAYMNTLGYQVFDMELAAAWRHSNNNNKRRAIGYEILFVKTENIDKLKTEQLKKYILLLELYGFRDYAIELLKNKNEDELSKALIENKRKSLKVMNNIFYKIINALNKLNLLSYTIYPNIKY